MKINNLLLSTLILTLFGCAGASDSSSTSSSSSSGQVQTPPNSSSSSSGATTISSSSSGSQIGANPISSSSSSGEIFDDSFFYFSYDDSASTASRDLSHFYIETEERPLSTWGRSYEYLNAEEFTHFNAEAAGPFVVSLGLLSTQINEIPLSSEIDSDESILSLGVNISGPSLSKTLRPNMVVTLLIDVSGSMKEPYATHTQSGIETLLDVTKHGLLQLEHALKPGDVINLASFNFGARTLLENWEYHEDDIETLQSHIRSLRHGGTTNLNAGIREAYALANRTFDAEKSNRVIILTDAIANSGVVDPETIAQHTVINGHEGIYFSGIGVGSKFNDDFLNELTDIGKGSYSAMITPEDAERLFTDAFPKFIDNAVSNVKFKLDYPDALRHLIEDSNAEEVSTDETDVQEINFSYNSHQFFLERFASHTIDENSLLTLTITYDNEDDENVEITIQKTLGDLLGKGEDSIKSASLVTTLADLVSNRLNCAEVESSTIWAESVEQAVFMEYHALITQFCSHPEW